MAKIRNYALAAKNITKQINSIVRDLSGSVADTAFQDVLYGATEVAKNTIISNNEHTQQFGDKLADEVSYKFSHDTKGEPTGVIYAPVSTDPIIAKQMYYLEHGAGITSVEKESIKSVWGSEYWGFFVDDENESEIKKLPNIKVKHRKNGSIFRKASTGQMVALVKESKPVHYMQAARRYVIKNINAKMRKQINTYFVRKTWKNRTVPFRGRKTKG